MLRERERERERKREREIERERERENCEAYIFQNRNASTFFSGGMLYLKYASTEKK